MTDTDPRIRVAQNLTAITHLAEHLLTQAVHSANDRELPGGSALAALGHAASIHTYSRRVFHAEAMWHAYAEEYDVERNEMPDFTADEDPNWEPPLQTLLYWSEAWRIEHDQELGARRPTLASEANFIRWALDWAWANEMHWEDFARDIANARRRIENLLRDGERAEQTRVECDQPAHDEEKDRPRLIKVYGDDPTGQADFWKCPKAGCKTHFDKDDLKRAQGRQLRRESAAKFVPLRDAVAVLTNLGRPERTVRSWLADIEEPVEVYCEVGTRRALVWWPDLWRRHLTTRTRNRGGSAA